MDENSHEDDRRIVQEIAGRFDAPSYMRRARLVETSWSNLLAHLARTRLEQLKIVRLHLGQLAALAGGLHSLAGRLLPEADLVALRQLHEELQPRLRMPLEPTLSLRIWRSSLSELREAMEAFNRRWPALLAKTDLKPPNAARVAYNRYYVLEKECALGSAHLACMDFRPLEPVTIDDLSKEFPLLKLPGALDG